MERRDEDWINPPEEKDEYEPDWDSINDNIWLSEHDDDDDDEMEIEVELEDDDS